MNIKPLGDRVVIKVKEEEETTKVVLSYQALQKTPTSTIVAVVWRSY